MDVYLFCYSASGTLLHFHEYDHLDPEIKAGIIAECPTSPDVARTEDVGAPELMPRLAELEKQGVITQGNLIQTMNRRSERVRRAKRAAEPAPAIQIEGSKPAIP